MSAEPSGEVKQMLAGAAAVALRRALANRASMGEPTVIRASGRPRHWHVYQWPTLPGFSKTFAFSTHHSAGPGIVTYAHTLLPGWEYEEAEIPEMIADLEHFADTGEQPKTATRPSKPRKAKRA